MSKKIAASEVNPRPFVYRERELYCDGVSVAALAEELREELRRRAVDREIADIIVGWVQTEANQELLIADGGSPWKTVSGWRPRRVPAGA